MTSWLRVPIHGGRMLIDLESWALYTSRSWHVNDTGYAVHRDFYYEDDLKTKKRTTRFHRLVAGTPDGMVTDHVNHDTLDNRSGNLRVCTQSDNMRNLRDQGKGYWFQKQNRNWVVEVYGQHVGCFVTETEAAEVARFVRAGGTYVKPERTQCSRGHSLDDSYDYGKGRNCRVCQSERSAKYYQRKKGINGLVAM